MSLEALFYPESIALIGASRNAGSVGNEIAENLAKQGYKGRLYLVNPKGGKLLGRRLIKDLSTIPHSLSLAIIAIPAEFVIEELKKLSVLGVKAVIVISAGFKEVGKKEQEVELAQFCKEHSIALIGPNCLGLLNPEVKLNASFAPLMPDFGNIAFVSQSGAICASVLDYAKYRELGFSKFVSIGNKAMLGEVEMLEYLYHDRKTKVIALYMEELEKIEKLKEIAVQITKGKIHKPIVILKSGRSTQGRKAALSHTGSLGGSDEAYEALFAQTGMIRAETIEELFDIIECFSRNKVLKNDRIAVITNAGGPGVLAADALAANGLRLAQLSFETKEKLRSFLPANASVANPVDMLGDASAEQYEKTLKAVLKDQNVDAVQIILTPQSMTEVEATARVIVERKKHTQKPIIVSFMGQGLVEKGVGVLNDNKIATSYFPESASVALTALHNFQKWISGRRSRPIRFRDVHPTSVVNILNEFKGKSEKLLPLEESFEVLSFYGFPVSKRWIVTSEKEAHDLSHGVCGLLALKILSPDISHKTDVGGVVLDVEPKDLESTYTKLVNHVHKKAPMAKIDGMQVMPMANKDGIELLLGVTTDPKLGKQIVVGLGGVYTEVYHDVSWGLAPLSLSDIERMIAHLRTVKILAGYRGHDPLATSNVAECLARLSQLVCDFPVIDEVDINPLKVMDDQKGVIILDARIVIS